MKTFKEFRQELLEMPVANFGDWIKSVPIEYKSEYALEHNYEFMGEIDILETTYQLRKLISNSNEHYRVGIYEPKNNENKFATYFQLNLDPEHDMLGYKNIHIVDNVKTAQRAQGDGFAQSVYSKLVKDFHYTLICGAEQYTGARRLWSRLSKNKDLSVDVIDLYKKQLLEKDVTLTQGKNDFDFDEKYWSSGDELRYIRFVLRKK
jgi:hypothetical protein